MTDDKRKTSLGLEYFCTEEDLLWKMNDVDLIKLATNELEKIGIISHKYFINGFVVRRKNVYPIYYLDYKKSIELIKNWLTTITNLQTMGRAGLFRYDNSDHSLLSGICAARNFLQKSESEDIWTINTDKEYLET